MNQEKSVFAQIMSLIPRYEFDKCVKRYNGNRHAIDFKCKDQFMMMSFAQFTGQILIAQARYLYRNEPSRLDVDGIVFAFDSSTMKLCLQLCPWARLHHDKGGVRMHTLLDLRGAIPTFIYLTEAAVHDSKAMSLVPVEPGNYYLMDKGYVDFKQLFCHFHRQRAFFSHQGQGQYEV